MKSTWLKKDMENGLVVKVGNARFLDGNKEITRVMYFSLVDGRTYVEYGNDVLEFSPYTRAVQEAYIRENNEETRVIIGRIRKGELR